MTKVSKKKETDYNGYERDVFSEKTIGLQKISLTKDGKKNTSCANIKVQMKYSSFKGDSKQKQPIRLSARGENNGLIYVTEGVENGLSIQECINNEVWCVLSIQNFLGQPYESNRKYVIVFDNDDDKPPKPNGKYQYEEIIENLKKYQPPRRKYDKSKGDNNNSNNNDNNDDNDKEDEEDEEDRDGYNNNNKNNKNKTKDKDKKPKGLHCKSQS